MPLWVSFALLGVGLIAIYVEIFVPAAGLIGLAGGGLIIAGVVVSYVEHGAVTGSIVLISSLVVTPVAVMVGLRLFPNTPVGRRLILSNPRHTSPIDSKHGSPAGGQSMAESGAVARGSVGTSLTDLRPSGMARFAGSKVSVVTKGEYLDRGAAVEVIQVNGNRIVVRERDD